MTIELRLKTKEDPDSPAELFVATFSDEEVELLRDFVKEADRLRQSQAALRALNAQISIEWDTQTGTCLNTRLPEDDDVAVLVHRMRPFILDRERTSFNKVAKLLTRRFQSPGFRTAIKTLRHEFSGKKQIDSWYLRAGEEVLNNAKMLDAWLNTFEYHRDEGEKSERFKLFEGLGPEPKVRGFMLYMLADRLNSVLRMAEVIAHLLRDDNDGKSATIVFLPEEDQSGV